MHALIRCLLAIALAVQLGLAGLCLTHDEEEVSLRVLHPPCGHEHEACIAAFRLRSSDTTHHTGARASSTPLHAASLSLTFPLPTAVRHVLALQPSFNEANSAVLGARGPPCAP